MKNDLDYPTTYRPYSLDRKETDSRHSYSAVKQLYAMNGLTRELSKQEAGKIFEGNISAERLDVDYGVDYVFEDRVGNLRFIQERLRPAGKYSVYNDITIRYARVKNSTEFEKIKKFIAQFSDKTLKYASENSHTQNPVPSIWLSYAFINDSTKMIQKHVFVNLRVLYELIKEGKIVPTEPGGYYYDLKHGYFDKTDQIFYAPIIVDRDGSASMLALNIPMLYKHFQRKEPWIKAIGNWGISATA